MRAHQRAILAGLVILGFVAVGFGLGHADDENDAGDATFWPLPVLSTPEPEYVPLGELPSTLQPVQQLSPWQAATRSPAAATLPQGSGTAPTPVPVEQEPGVVPESQRQQQALDLLRRQLGRSGLSPEEVDAEVQQRMDNDPLGAVDARVGGIEGVEPGAVTAPVVESSWPGTPMQQDEAPEKRFFKRMEPNLD